MTGQYRDTGNNGHKMHNENKQTNNTIQKNKNMNNMDTTRTWFEPREESRVTRCHVWCSRAVLLIAKCGAREPCYSLPSVVLESRVTHCQVWRSRAMLLIAKCGARESCYSLPSVVLESHVTHCQV